MQHITELKNILIIIGIIFIIPFVSHMLTKKPTIQTVCADETVYRKKFLLHLLLQTECNTCSDETAYLVLSTVFNRARKQNKEIEEIIFEPNQYVIRAQSISGRFTNVINTVYKEGLPDTSITRFCNKEVAYKFKNFKPRYFMDGLLFGE